MRPRQRLLQPELLALTLGAARLLRQRLLPELQPELLALALAPGSALLPTLQMLGLPRQRLLPELLALALRANLKFC